VGVVGAAVEAAGFGTGLALVVVGAPGPSVGPVGSEVEPAELAT
jgi:hypothetical protein